MGVRNTIDWARAYFAVRKTGEDVMRAAAEFMADRAAYYCPVDTGELRSSIGVLTSLGGGDGELVYKVVATARHAAPVEYGHYTARGLFVAPNPFMRQALADTVTAFPSIAARYRLDSGGRSLGSSSGGGYRNVTFASGADQAFEADAGAFSGPSAGFGVSLGV